jgi:hypothetical protein
VKKCGIGKKKKIKSITGASADAITGRRNNNNAGAKETVEKKKKTRYERGKFA